MSRESRRSSSRPRPARRPARILAAVLGAVLLLVVLLAALGVFIVRRSFPQTAGELKAAGLQGPVDVYRDAYGVPQIYAASTHDLFFAQGYVHAQDRFFQMDFWRHIGAARLSEMFGESQLDTDRFLRTLGFARIAQQELEAIDPTSRAILEAYSAGVNAYLAQRQGSALSLEYGVLKLINSGYQPEPWTPANTLTWAKVMAWDLSDQMGEEISRAQLLRHLPADQVDALFPPYPQNHPTIITQPIAVAGRLDPARAETRAPAEVLARVAGNFAALDRLVGERSSDIGSNNWVISGRLTATGKPFLANDPHLGEQIPSIWYEVGLHCTAQGPDCPYNVTGFSFAGAPGVIIGHNDRIAWGVTNVGPDVQDLYLEKINPQNPNQYEVDGQWVDMDLVKETIQVAGGDPVEITARSTRHGPVVSDTYGKFEKFADESGLTLPEAWAVALKWTALEPNYLFRAIWQIDRAQDWDEFRQGARDFTVPAQNLVFADIDGNIGYQMPGNIPIRSSGNGTMLVAGWTGEGEWQGYVPFEELPSVFNPPDGFIVTANNAVVGPSYPYLITASWDYGYRAQRIVDLIKNAGKPIDAETIQKIQGDSLDLNAQALAPVLLKISFDEPRLEQAKAILANWDFQAAAGSAPAALFEAFWRHLINDAFRDDLPESNWPEGGSRWFAIVQGLVQQPESPWWDDADTKDKETRDAIFVRAFRQAVDELEAAQGKNPAKWRWGDLHTVTFHNQSLGKSGISPIEALFNRGPFPVSGTSSVVNNTGWSAEKDEYGYRVRSLPSMRMIVDLGSLSNSLAVHTTGQSGHAYHPHYIDQASLWQDIQYHPMLWDPAQIETAPGGHLRLAP